MMVYLLYPRIHSIPSVPVTSVVLNDPQANDCRKEERVLQLFRLLNYCLKKEKVKNTGSLILLHNRFNRKLIKDINYLLYLKYM